MERLPLAVSYAMATATMVAHVSWILKQMYPCVCEYFTTFWAFSSMALVVHGIPALLFSFLGGKCILNKYFTDTIDQVLSLIGSCATESPLSPIGQ